MLLWESRRNLYALPWSRRAGKDPQRIAALPERESWRDNGWSVSHDGTSIAYLADSDAATAVHVAMLPGMQGQRALFTMPKRNQGRAGDVASPALRSVESVLVKSVDGCPMEYLEILGLLYCSDKRTLLINMKQPGTIPWFVTCAIDLRSGRALSVDRAGAWQSINQGARIAARGNILLSCGVGRTTDEHSVCNSCSQFNPIEVMDLRRPMREGHTLLTARFDSKHIPEYAFAWYAALAPNMRTVAFYSFGSHDSRDNKKGIWTVDRSGRHYRRLTHDRDVRQIEWESPSSLLVLKAGGDSGAGDSGAGDLVRLPLLDGGERAGKPEILLRDIARFQLLECAE